MTQPSGVSLMLVLLGIATMAASAHAQTGRDAFAAIILTDEAVGTLTAPGCRTAMPRPVDDGKTLYQVSGACFRDWLAKQKDEQVTVFVQTAPPAAPSGLPGPGAADAQIRAKCARDWPDNFRMQEYCIKQQRESYERLRRQ